MKKAIVLLSVLISLLTFTATATQALEENMYYFFDDRIVSSSENASLVIGDTTKTVTESTWLDQYNWTSDSDIPEWENRVTIMYPHVIYDENGISVDGVSSAKYKLWYHSYCTQAPESDYKWFDFIIDKTNSRGVDIGDFKNDANGRFDWAGYALCYMESNDGIHWTRPDCGEFYYKKQNGEIVGTNIVLIGQHGAGIHQNTHPDAGNGEPLYIMATTGTAISWSDDGIHWEAPICVKDGNKTENHMPGDTHNQIMWSPELERYVVISRGFIDGVRTVLQFTSKENLVSLRDMAKLSTYEERTAYWTEPEHVLTGTADAQPYSVPVIYAAEGYYIGVVSVADFLNNGKGVYQQVHAELVWSPDATNWSYILNGTPFIANAESFEFAHGNDYGMIFTAAPVVTGDTTKIFYAATPELHYFNYKEIPDNIKSEMQTFAPKAVEAQFITRSTTLNVVEFPTDRYAGYRAENGTVTTKRFKITGDKLTFNADGIITAAIYDTEGNALDGFSHDDFSSSDGVMRWSGDLRTLINREVYLEFHLKDATLYTIGGCLEAQELVKLDLPKEITLVEGSETIINANVIPCTAYSPDSLIYESSDKAISVDESGKIVGLSTGIANLTVYTPDRKYSEVITVKVTSPDAVIWEDGFENGLSEWGVRDSSASGFADTEPYSYITLNGNTHSGSKSFGLSKSGKQILIRKTFDQNMNKVLTICFFDDTSRCESRLVACAESSNATRISLGLHSATSTESYTMWVDTTQYIDTGVKRSNGWHEFTWDFTSGTHVDVYIDSVKVNTNTKQTFFNQITLGWWTASSGTVNYFDDVKISEKLPWESGLVKGAENFTATANGNDVTLSWTNPLNPDWYDDMIIVCNNEKYPESPSDGTVIATITDKTVTSFLHKTDGMNNCYYAIFSRKGNRYSEASRAETSFEVLPAEAKKLFFRHYKKGTNGVSAEITMNHATRLDTVTLDGKILSGDCYSFENSTVTLAKKYLDSLDDGIYSFTLGFDKGKVAISVKISNTIFEEDFEYGFDTDNLTRIKDGTTWVTPDADLNNAKIVELDQTHAFTNDNSQIALVEKVFDTSVAKVVHVSFYDDGVSRENDTYVKVVQNSAPLVGIGIKNNSSQYSYLYYSGVYVNTGIERSKGWHTFSVDFTNGYPELYVDYRKVAELSGKPSGSTAFPMSTFTKVWAGWFVGSNSGCAFDNIRVTDSLYEKESLELKGTSLVLDGAIGIKTYFDIDTQQINAEDVTLKTTVLDTVTQVSSDQIKSLSYDSEKRLYYTVTYIPPKDADNVYVSHTLTCDAVEISTQPITVTDYVTAFKELAETNTEYQRASALVNAIEVYISNADCYFNKKPTATVTADVTRGTAPSVSGEADGISLHSTSLLLEGKTTIRHYFTTAEGVTPVFTLDGKPLFYGESNGLIYVDIPNISANDIDKAYTVTVSDSLSITFSALNYIELAMQTDDTELKNVIMALYNYFVESERFSE